MCAMSGGAAVCLGGQSAPWSQGGTWARDMTARASLNCSSGLVSCSLNLYAVQQSNANVAMEKIDNG